jgi:hypothetical protein
MALGVSFLTELFVRGVASTALFLGLLAAAALLPTVLRLVNAFTGRFTKQLAKLSLPKRSKKLKMLPRINLPKKSKKLLILPLLKKSNVFVAKWKNAPQSWLEPPNVPLN